MKAGLNRLSIDDARFFVDLNPGNWKLFNVILALLAVLTLSVDLPSMNEAAFHQFLTIVPSYNKCYLQIPYLCFDHGKIIE